MAVVALFPVICRKPVKSPLAEIPRLLLTSDSSLINDKTR